MSWRVYNLKNTVHINTKCADDLFKILEPREIWSDYDRDIVYQVKQLHFNLDHKEHMDYLSQEDICNILKKHKVKGDVCFGSFEGDNNGEIWGYRFDGKGHIIKLKGQVIFEPVKKKK